MGIESFKDGIEQSSEGLPVGEVVENVSFDKDANGDYVGYDEKGNVFILPSGPGTEEGEYTFSGDVRVIYTAQDEAGDRRYIVEKIAG